MILRFWLLYCFLRLCWICRGILWRWTSHCLQFNFTCNNLHIRIGQFIRPLINYEGKKASGQIINIHFLVNFKSNACTYLWNCITHWCRVRLDTDKCRLDFSIANMWVPNQPSHQPCEQDQLALYYTIFFFNWKNDNKQTKTQKESINCVTRRFRLNLLGWKQLKWHGTQRRTNDLPYICDCIWYNRGAVGQASYHHRQILDERRSYRLLCAWLLIMLKKKTNSKMKLSAYEKTQTDFVLIAFNFRNTFAIHRTQTKRPLYKIH